MAMEIERLDRLILDTQIEIDKLKMLNTAMECIFKALEKDKKPKETPEDKEAA